MKNVELRQQYLRDHPTCQYCWPLRSLVKNAIPACVFGAVEADHIWGGNGGRWDVVSNLIASCRPCHEWKTRNETMGRIAAYWVKLKSAEVNEDEFRAISGRVFRGWLSNVSDGCGGLLLPGFTGLAVDLLQRLERSEQ